MEKNSFLGKSLIYPLVINDSGSWNIVDGLESIKQSIASILETPVGTRFFLRDYGSRIFEVQFEPNDQILQTLLDAFIPDALTKWEKRISVKTISYEEVSVSQINCTVTYEILESNEIDSFVYPFYREIIY